MAVSAIGCGQGFKSGSNNAGSTGAQAVTGSIDDQLAKADEAQQEAAVAMNDAQTAVNGLLDSNGNINLLLFTKSSSSQVQTSGVLAGLVNKLKPLFDTAFNKVAAAKQKYDDARTALNNALNAINQADPAAADTVAKLKAQLSTLDSAEASFLNSVHLLAGKLTLVSSALDGLVSGVTSFIPGYGAIIGWVLDNFVMDDVKNLILDLQTKLLAL